jgi:hypothetical protein
VLLAIGLQLGIDGQTRIPTNGDSSMYALTFVLFTASVNDEMILQLRDPDPQKGKEAAAFLHKEMRESYGPQSLAVLMKVKQAAKDKQKEI